MTKGFINTFLVLSVFVTGVFFLLGSTPEEEYKGDKPTSSFEEAKKTHIVGIIPTKMNYSNLSIEEDWNKFEIIESWNLEYEKEKLQAWDAYFKALNRAIEEKLISAYVWNYTELTIHFNDGYSISFAFNTHRNPEGIEYEN